MRIVTVQNRVRIALVLLAGLTAAGCNTTAQTTGSVGSARASAVYNTSIAFESIDGPPPGVFQKLVQNLDTEANNRQLPMVSRQGPANYRIRGYMAANTINNRTSYTWVWDVYDADQRRALRISGEIPGRTSGGDAWAGADDEVVRRIAQTGMDRVATFIASPAANTMASAAPATTSGATYGLASVASSPAPAPSVDEPSRQTFAQNDDFSPEAAGIFRLLRPTEPATAPTNGAAAEPAQVATAEPRPVPIPPQRPVNQARKKGTTVTVAAGPDTTQD